MGAIKAGDTLSCIQYICRQKRKKTLRNPSTILRKVHIGNAIVGIEKFAKILTDKTNKSPLYITFHRMVQIFKADDITSRSIGNDYPDNGVLVDGTMRKMDGCQELHLGGGVLNSEQGNEVKSAFMKNTSNDDPIMIDESDDENEVTNNKNTTEAAGSTQSSTRVLCKSPTNHSEYEQSTVDIFDVDKLIGAGIPTSIDPFQSRAMSIFKSSSDPSPQFQVDEFVKTPVGPGRVLSMRIEQTSNLMKSFYMYTVDLGFGYCNLPSQSLSIQSYDQNDIVRYSGVVVNEYDRLRLWPEIYLNDSLINFYIKYLQRDRFSENEEQHVDIGFHFFSTFFYSRLSHLDGGNSTYKNTKKQRHQLWKDLKGWTKGVDIFEKDFLIVPVNYHLHWTFVLVCNPGQIMNESSTQSSLEVEQTDQNETHLEAIFPNVTCCMIHLDSAKNLKFHNPSAIFKTIRLYLAACWEARRTSLRFNPKSFPGFCPEVPVQTNLKDCGVYMLEMIERILINPPTVDSEFVRKRAVGCSPFSKSWFHHDIIDIKRNKIDALLYEFRNVQV